MSDLHRLSPPKGATRSKKRIARGHGAGQGKTAGRGHKGQRSRSGGGTYPGFEGGQTQLYRRIPKKRGFYNPLHQSYVVINVGDLARFAVEKKVSPEQLLACGVLSRNEKLKVLGNGTIREALEVISHQFSNQAKTKIEQAGGKVVLSA